MRFALLCGIIVAMILARLTKEKFGIDFDTFLEVLIGGMVFGLVGARLFYVIFKYHSLNPVQIFNIRDGGLAIYGGIIAIIGFLLVYCKIKKINFLNLVDYLIPYLAIGQCIGRWGNFFNVEAYGGITNSIFRMGIETSSGYIEVHPVFLYESIATLLIFVVLSILKRKRKFEGQIFYLYFIMYGFVRFLLEGLRQDSLMLGKIRVSSALSFVLFWVFLVLYVLKRRKIKKEEK